MSLDGLGPGSWAPGRAGVRPGPSGRPADDPARRGPLGYVQGAPRRHHPVPACADVSGRSPSHF
jgi:hypothetical protein